MVDLEAVEDRVPRPVHPELARRTITDRRRRRRVVATESSPEITVNRSGPALMGIRSTDRQDIVRVRPVRDAWSSCAELRNLPISRDVRP